MDVSTVRAWMLCGNDGVRIDVISANRMGSDWTLSRFEHGCSANSMGSDWTLSRFGHGCYLYVPPHLSPKTAASARFSAMEP